MSKETNQREKPCPRWSRAIDLWLDGELSPEHKRELREHLARCPACAKEARELRAARRALAKLPGLSPRASFRQRLRVALLAEVDKQRRRRWVRLALAPALVGAAFALVWLLPARDGLAPSAPRSEAPRAAAVSAPLQAVGAAQRPSPAQAVAQHIAAAEAAGGRQAPARGLARRRAAPARGAVRERVVARRARGAGPAPDRPAELPPLPDDRLAAEPSMPVSTVVHVAAAPAEGESAPRALGSASPGEAPVAPQAPAPTAVVGTFLDAVEA